jgi:hypothetical protein
VEQDLHRVEKQLMELEALSRLEESCDRSQQFELLHTTCLKLWHFLSGELRPRPPPQNRFKSAKSLYRTKMPKICTG